VLHSQTITNIMPFMYKITFSYLLFLTKFRLLYQMRIWLSGPAKPNNIILYGVFILRTTNLVNDWIVFMEISFFLQVPMWLMKQTTLFISIWIRKQFCFSSLASLILMEAKMLTAMRIVLWLCCYISSCMY
jgi:hypothetical protein